MRKQRNSRKGYSFVAVRKERCSDACANRQPSLFENQDVVAHVETSKTSSLCANPSPKSRRNTMLLSYDNTPPPTNWHRYNQAQSNEKHRFQELLFDLCSNVNDLPRIPGAGRNRLPMSDMLFAVIYKTYECLSGRRFMCDLKEAKLKGFMTRTPHFNSVFNYLDHPDLYLILKELIRQSSLPLKDIEVNFAVDSSGFSTGQFTRWMEHKWNGVEYQAGIKWLKCHLMCGVSTNIVTSVEITDKFHADHGQFEPLVNETALHFQLHNVSADKAYLSRKNLELVNNKGGTAFIPFKPNNRPSRKHGAVWNAMYHMFHLHSDKFAQNYHKRSNVESTFSMIKRKFGERLRSKSDTAQTNEVLCKILCHNICCIIHAIYELGIETDFQRIRLNNC
jgi:transposase